MIWFWFSHQYYWNYFPFYIFYLFMTSLRKMILQIFFLFEISGIYLYLLSVVHSTFCSIIYLLMCSEKHNVLQLSSPISCMPVFLNDYWPLWIVHYSSSKISFKIPVLLILCALLFLANLIWKIFSIDPINNKNCMLLK